MGEGWARPSAQHLGSPKRERPDVNRFVTAPDIGVRVK